MQFDALRATAGPKKGQAWDQTRISSQVTDEAFVHPKPPGCPDSIYDTIIVRCLEYEPDARPRFTAIRAKLAAVRKTLGGVDGDEGATRTTSTLRTTSSDVSL